MRGSAARLPDASTAAWMTVGVGLAIIQAVYPYRIDDEATTLCVLGEFCGSQANISQGAGAVL
jgi:hypothetical protein